MQDAASIEHLLAAIMQRLVETPESVKILPVPEADRTHFRVVVPETELGHVIGKQGRTAKAVRTVLAAASQKLNCRASLEFTTWAATASASSATLETVSSDPS